MDFEIEEIGGNIKEVFGKNWAVILLCFGGVILIYVALKGSNDDSSNTTMIVPTGYTSYPDAVTNANVIIDSVNQNSDYNTEVILDQLDDMTTNNNEWFENTNNYIGEKFEGLADDLDGMEENLNKQFTSTNNYIGQGLKDLNTRLDKDFAEIGDDLSTINKNVTSVGTQVGNSYNKLTDLINKSTSSIKNSVSTTTTKTSTSTAPNYYAKSNYTGVSIVDGLKSIGVYYINGKDVGQWQSRVNLASANGITNYTGSASQNTKLLNLLKQGKLIKG